MGNLESPAHPHICRLVGRHTRGTTCVCFGTVHFIGLWRWRKEQLNQQPPNPIQPFLNSSSLSAIYRCSENSVMISLTVRELSCWQTNRHRCQLQTNKHTNRHYGIQYHPRCAGGNQSTIQCKMRIDRFMLQCIQANPTHFFWGGGMAPLFGVPYGVPRGAIVATPSIYTVQLSVFSNNNAFA